MLEITNEELTAVLQDPQVTALIKSKLVALKTANVDNALSAAFAAAGLHLTPTAIETDALGVSATAIEVARGSSAEVVVTYSGPTPLSMNSTDTLVTGTLLGNVLTISVDPATTGPALVTLYKGNQTVSITVTPFDAAQDPVSQPE